MHIGIVAGEMSGDQLGGGLIHALRQQHPQAMIEGIGGPQMEAVGFHSHYPIETLSVMGLVEVIKHYPRIKRCYDQLRDFFCHHRPAVFVGIDAPDFNLRLELALKQARIPTVHYVSPSVWAWRQHRWRKIARAVDLMLTLFPFEAAFYQQHQIPVRFVGHPLADDIPLAKIAPQQSRIKLGLSPEGIWIALLPGSRVQEIHQLGALFLQTAHWLWRQYPNLRFIIPVAHPTLQPILMRQITNIAPDLPVHLLTGQSHLAMAAADLILTASGTATLEALLLKRPMVVAYRLASITYWIAKRLVNLRYFSLPNLLAQEMLVPEFLQHQVTPENLGTTLRHWLENPQLTEKLTQRFLTIHQQLRQNANQQAAETILAVANSKKL